ncbi:hypothetical protein G7076_11620 [Sphingomonas sp. HDW15A]|uniref:hypothetical protein n=1 Tax=Sphingomonas sp. HDW15A TaxID=2714942 RepID=UPI00140D74F8|nr:hypothetical protein [Sphingomonas sp. HDW15A]QIK96983.1 hypothetical protein G7076_11620 [Sphingomonas sp. HDW15A]
MAFFRHWWKVLAALLALIGAGTVAAVASAPVADGWSADPDEQFLLDVSLRRLRLGDGVRAYTTPSGPCLVFGDFLTALDVPMKIDLEANRASGWAFDQKNSIEIDKAAGIVILKGKRESFASTVVRDVPEGWCVDAQYLGRWFSLSLEAKTGISLLQVESEAKLPVELAAERRLRAAQLKRKASIETADLPRVRLPYRLWRAPALEFMVNAGATYSADSGLKVDRSVAVAGAGEIAAMSYSFRVSGSSERAIDTVRAQIYRSDPDGNLLGPLKATHFAIGDVEGVRSDFSGGSAVGRGVVVTNEPLTHRSNFDRTSFTGELPDGWDAELYRNDSLVAFYDGADGDGLYHFDNVEMLYGENNFEVVLYGPQGQIQRRVESVNVGQDNVPPGTFWYWAGIRQPNTPLLAFRESKFQSETELIDSREPSKAPDVAVEARYGVSERLSVGALIRSLEVQDERLSYVEGSFRYSIGRALGELAIARDTRGGTAFRAQVATKVGRVNLNAATQFSQQFIASTDESGTAIKAEHRLGASVPIKLGQVAMPLSGDVRLVERLDGGKELDAAARLSTRIGRFNLAGETTVRRQLRQGDNEAKGNEVDASLIASGYVGRVRLRGGASWKVEPERRFDSAEINAYWSAGETTDLEAGIAYTADTQRLRGRMSYIRRFDAMAVSITGEAASDGSVAAGVSLNFAMDPFQGNWRPTRQRLATTGLVKARVFEDLNENGRRDKDEPAAAEAFVTTGLKLADRPTDKNGTTLIGGLAPYVPVAVGIDQSSLANPALAPAKPAQVVVPRPGVDATVEIALVGGGSIEGYAAKEDGSEYEGLELQLVALDGEVLASAMSDIDGYFLFERVRYGSYKLRLAPGTAKAISASADLGVAIVIDRDKPLGRLGVVRILRSSSLAQAASSAESSGTTLR